MKRFAIFIGILALIGGIGWHIRVQAALLKRICFNLTGHEILKLTFEEAIITLFIEIKNPSDIDITVDSYDFDILVDGRKVAKAKKKIGQKILKDSSSELSITFSFEPKNIFNALLTADVIKGILLRKEKTKIRIKGFVSVSHGKWIKLGNMPVDIEMPLSQMIPKPDVPKEVC